MITSVLPAGLVGMSGTASAHEHGAWYTLSQPGTEVCYEVQAFTNDHEKMVPEVRVRGSNDVGDVTGPYEDPDWDGPVTIESIMDYRYRYYPEGSDGAVGQTSYYAPYLNDQYRYEGWEFGTYGLYNWSENGDSHLWFYQNANGEVSLVVRHDKLYEDVATASHNPYNGEYNSRDGFFERSPGDGEVTFTFDSLPSGEWAYLDDLYPNAGMGDTYTDSDDTRYGHREANYDSTPIGEFDGGYFQAYWTWQAWNAPNGTDKHGTDGGAYRGFQNLADGESVTVTNSFSGDLDEWEVRLNDGTTNGQQEDLVMGEPLVITRGQHCLDDGGELTATPDPVESGETVSFEAPSGASEYRWDWNGDGSAENTTGDNTFQHAYDDSGDVQVTVTMAEGNQTVTKQTTVTVRERQSPTADFRVEDDAGDPNHHVVGEELTFNGSVSTDNVAVASYEWEFDGTTRTGERPTHAFDSNGTHEVTLTVTDRAGQTDTVNRTVEVVAEDDPEARASASPTEAEAGAPITLDGSASSDERGVVETYDWSAPDGGEITDEDPSDPSATVSLPSAGEYNVTLTVTDNNGNTDSQTIQVSATEATAPTIDSVTVPENVSAGGSFEVEAAARDESTPLTYSWTFRGGGNDDQKTGQSASHTFTDEGDATVELVVTDAAGQTNSTSVEVSVTGKPSAALTAEPANPRVGDNVTLDASNSTDAGTIEEYRWRATADGNVTTTTSPTYNVSYDSSGTYEATVVVVDDDGQTDTANVTVEVQQEKAIGGGGGGGGSTSLGPPPVLTKTEQVGPNEFAIDVRNGRADEKVKASLPTSEVASQTGVTFERVAVDLAREDAHTVFRTAVSADPPANASPPGASETLAYLDVSANYLGAPVEGTTVTVSVDRSALGDLASPDDVAMYRYDDGTWTQANATVVETTGDAVRVKATTDGLGTLAVGTESALAVTDAEVASEVTTGKQVEATATVENRGAQTRTAAVNLTLSGSVVASETVEVPAGEEVSVTVSGTAPAPGTYDVQVGDASAGTLTVQEVQPADVSVTDVSLGSSTIAAGETVEVVATVENSGGEPGETNVTLTMFGEELASETVRVAGGETERVTFDQRVDAAGSYTVEVDGETAELTVESEGESLGERAPGVPGFGVGAALVALLGAALVARLRG